MLVELAAESLAELEGLQMDGKVIVWPGTPAGARAVMNRLFMDFFNRITSMITTQKSFYHQIAHHHATAVVYPSDHRYVLY
jgi:hypothetical protein